MSSGKQEFDVDWQRAAASLLVAIGSHDPDLVCFSQPFPLLFLETTMRYIDRYYLILYVHGYLKG
jgi:hypothetical protein